MSVQRDVAVRYALEYTDRGLARAVTTTRALEQASMKSGAAVVLASRRQSDAWRMLNRDAAQFDNATTRRALGQGAAVSRSVDRQIGSLHKLGASYKEIAAIMRTAGASANQTAAAIEHAAAKEEAAYARVNRVRDQWRRGAASAIGLGAAPHSTLGAAAGGVSGRVRSATGMGVGMLTGGLLGLVSIQGMKSAVEQTKELAKETRVLTQVTGMDARTAAQWAAVAQSRGIQTRALNMSFKTLATQTEAALGGTKKSVGAFQALGISYKDVTSHAHDMSGLMGIVADHLKKMPGGTEKTALAAKLLGRGWASLVPILGEGSKAMAEQRKQAAAYGVTLGKDPLKNAKKLEEASYNLKLAQIGLSVQFTEHVAPALIKATTYGIKLAVAIGHELAPAFHTLGPIVKDTGRWLKDHKDVVIALAGAFVGLKVIRTVSGWFGGLYKDGKRAFDFLRGTVAIVTGQGRETDKLAVSNQRLAASLEAIAAASRGATVGMETLTAAELAQRRAGGAAGAGGLILPGGAKGAAGGVATAARGEQMMAAETRQLVQQGGMMGMMFGRTGLQQLTNTVGSDAKRLLTPGGKTPAVPPGETAAAARGGGLLRGAAGLALPIMAISGLFNAITGKGGTGGVSGVGQRFLSGATLGLLKTPDSATAQIQKQVVGANQQQLDALRQVVSKSKALGALSNTQVRQAQQLIAARQQQLRDAQATGSRQTISGIRQSQGASQFSTVQSQLPGITSGLNKLTGQWRNAGALSAIEYARGLEQNGRMPKGSTDKLIRALEGKFPGLAQYLSAQGALSMKLLSDQLQVNKVQASAKALVDKVHSTFQFLPDFAHAAGNSTQAKMQSTMDGLKHIIATGTAAQRAAAIPELAALQADYDRYMAALKKRAEDTAAANKAAMATIGQDTQNAATSVTSSIQGVITSLTNFGTAAQNASTYTLPGGGAFIAKHAGGGWVAGDPHRDGTLALLAGNEFVLTGHGQEMLHAHAPGLLEHIAGSQLPHFQDGGPVASAAGALGWPDPTKKKKSSTGHHTASHKTAKAKAPKATHWYRTGATLDDTGPTAGYPPGRAFFNNGMSYAELEATPGFANYAGGGMRKLLGLGQGGLGLPPGFAVLARPLGSSSTGIQLLKSDVGDGAGNAPHATIDLHGAASRALGGISKGDIEIAIPGTSAAAGFTGSAGPKTTKVTTHSLIGLAMGEDQAFATGFQEGLIGHSLAGLASAAGQAAIWKTTVKNEQAGNSATGKKPSTTAKSGGALASMIAVANANNQKWTYGQGTSHGRWSWGPEEDCSSTVSKILAAGGVLSPHGWVPNTEGLLSVGLLSGSGSQVSVYDRPNQGNNSHTIMNLGGRWYGTSRANAGGGPGWISPGSGYLSTFPVHMHPKGLRTGGAISTNRTRPIRPPRARATPQPPSMGWQAPTPVSITGDVSQLLGAGFNNATALAAIARISHSLDMTSAYSELRLEGMAKSYERLLAHLKHIHAPRMDQRRIATVLALIEGEIGRRAGMLVKAGEDLVDPVRRANLTLGRFLASSKGRINLSSSKWLSVLAATQNVPESAFNTQISDLQKAYRIAMRQHNKGVMSTIVDKLAAAMANLRTTVEARFQGYVDSATHAATMAQSGEQSLELHQQLAGTFGTPAAAKQQSDYITQNIVPAMEKEKAALERQQAEAKKLGDTALAQQIAEAIANQSNAIDQAKIDALNKIKDATAATAANTQALSGQLGVGFQGQTLPDWAGILNAA